MAEENIEQPSEEPTFEQMSNDPTFTEEDLKAELNRYAKALEEEYETNVVAEPENIAEYTTNFFKGNAHSAAAQIVYLAINADSESVRLNAAKFVVQIAREKEEADADPIGNLIAKLKTNKNVKVPASEEGKTLDSSE